MPGTSRSNGARSMPSSIRPGGQFADDHRLSATHAHADGALGARIHLRLPVEAESVTAAHHCVLGIAPALDPDMLDDVRLLISELVTNAIRHAGLSPDDWIELVVEVGSDQVRVEVRDPGPGFDPARLSRSKQAPTQFGGPSRTGWGLEFLRRIASRWGVEHNGLTSVWFELDLRPPPGGTCPPRRGHG